MSNDQEVQVQFKAVVGDLESGLRQAAEGVKDTTTGMTGDVGNLAETISSMGSSALVLAGVGLAFEALKTASEFIAEAVKDTNELAESFEKLSYATGASLEQLNIYTVALELSGDKAGDLEALIIGQQRAIKANAALLVENGLAANRAALDAMPFEEYLRKVHEITESLATPTERQQFLMLALGRGGAMAGQQIKEFVENMEEAKQIVAENSGIMQTHIDQLNETDRSLARLQSAQRTYAAAVASSATPIMNAFRDIRTDVINFQITHETAMDLAHQGLIRMEMDLETGTTNWEKMTAAAKAFQKNIADGMRTAGDSMDAGARFVPEPEKKPLKTAEGVAAAKKAAEERARIEREALAARVAVELNVAKDLEEEKRNLEKAAAKERAEGLREWLAKLKEEAREEEKLEAKKLRDAEKADAVLEAKKKKHLKEQQEQYQQFFGSISSGFGNVVDDMIVNQQSFSQVMDQLERQALANLAKSAITYIGNQAAKAAAGAAASAAESGPTGWAIAIPVAMAVLSSVLGLQSQVASAAQGYDIPAGVNPLTQLHEREMVLPQKEADTIRGLKGSGGGRPIIIQALDRKSFLSALRDNKSPLARVFREMRNDGRTS